MLYTSISSALFSPYLDYHPYPFAAPYVNKLHSYEKRRIFAMLHTNCFPVKSNLARFNSKIDDLCSRCCVKENEFHIIFECTNYQDIRDKYLPKNMLVSRDNNENVLRILLCTNDVYVLECVVLFLQHVLNERLS